MQSISIRPVKKSDSKMLWEWANDPVVRSESFSTDSITWENHEKWFDKKMKDSDCKIYIAEKDGEPIGQVRFDCEDVDTIIDVHLAPDQRGKGLGTEMMQGGLKKFFADSKAKEVTSFVKVENTASQKMFEKIGFKNLGVIRMNDCDVFHLVFPRS